MADLHRIARLALYFFVGLLLGANIGLARADYPAVGKWSYPWTTNSGGFASVAAVCAYDITIPSWQTSWPGYTFTCVNIVQPSPAGTGTIGTYQVKAEKPPYSPSYSNRSTTYYFTCPDGGTLSGNVCTIPCVPPQVTNPATGFCEADCSSKKGQNLSSGWYDMGTDPAVFPPWLSSSCSGECQVRFSGIAPAGQDNQTPRRYYAKGSLDFDGWSCNAGDPAPSTIPQPPQTCPAGQCPGTVNGTAVCVPCGSQDTTQKTVSNKTDSSTNSTTTTTVTVGPNNSVTTTTTNVSNGGQGIGATQPTPTNEETKQQDKDGFCVENPDIPLCKQSSFGGGCGAFTCDGDAVQCAMAKEQHKRNCTMFDTPTPMSQLGEQVTSGSDPQNASMPWHPSQVATQDLSAAISQDKWLASGGFADKTFQVAGQTITIPLSKANPFLEIMGQIVVAFALIAAAKIVGVF